MTAAVLIIDMQKDFFLKDYKDQAYSKVVERTVVANTNRLLAAARPAGLPVIHSITRYKADRSDWTLRMKDINYEVCIEGTPGVELVLCGLLGLDALVRFFNYSTEPPQATEYDAGPAENYPPGSRMTIPEAEAILVHTAGGFLAFSNLCPHLGCTVEVSGDGFVCPCHASRFDAQGVVV